MTAPTARPRLVRTVAALTVLAVTAVPALAQQKEHPLAPAIRVAKSSRKTLDGIADYQGVFSKQELVNGRLQDPEFMFVKIRHQPFSVYLKFLKPHEGREVIYVDGQNDGNILAHESGIASLVGTVAIPVNSPKAMSNNRYPITRMGLKSMVQGVIDQWEEESKYGETEVKYFPNAKLQEMECKVIQSSHPRPRKQFKFHMTRLFIDKKTNLPVRVEQYGFPAGPGARPPLLEQYTFSRVKVDQNLTGADFDPRNPAYGF